MIKAIVFDAYGTLVSTGDGSIRAAAKILERNGAHISPKAFYADWKKYHRKHLDELSDFQTEEAVFHMDLRALYGQYHLKRDADEDVAIMLDTLGRLQLFPETLAAVEELKREYLVCIGSTTDTGPLLADLERGGLTVHHIFTSEMLRVYKPQPEFYRQIVRALGLKPEEILFVGDSLLDDIWGPKEIGMKTCWVDRKKQTADWVRPDLTVDDLTGIKAGLESAQL